MLLGLLRGRLIDLSTDVCGLSLVSNYCGQYTSADKSNDIGQVFQGVIMECFCHWLNIESVNRKKTGKQDQNGRTQSPEDGDNQRDEVEVESNAWNRRVYKIKPTDEVRCERNNDEESTHQVAYQRSPPARNMRSIMLQTAEEQTPRLSRKGTYVFHLLSSRFLLWDGCISALYIQEFIIK